MYSHLLFSHFRFIFAKLYLHINKRTFGINQTAKVQISCVDQNSNCILGKMLQILYLIEFDRAKVHTVSSMISIDIFFAQKK